MATVQRVVWTKEDELDEALAVLAAKKGEWAVLPIREKIQLLEELVRRGDRVAQQWVDAATVGKRLKPNTPWVGEEWISGPWAFIEGCQSVKRTLESIADGQLPDLPEVRELRDGRAAVRVFPANQWDALLLNGFTGEVWMQDGVTPANLHENIASFYFEGDETGKVALVLGAGNISSIAPLDMVHRLYHQGQVVITKLNPVMEWMGPLLEEIFEPFVRRGYVRFAYGDHRVGSYLTQHELVEEMHLTGSERTHDAIVFGVGEEGQRRKERDEPIVDKPFTSELGGVGPTIVVPGTEWSDEDFRYQAEQIATQKLHNSGHNCVAAQVLILPSEWEHAARLQDEIKRVFEELPPRPMWYPGAEEAQKRAVSRHERHHVVGSRTLLVDIPHDEDHFAFEEEFFAPVFAVTSLPGRTPEEFWRKAVKFANERLRGTLGVNIVVHPSTRKKMGARFDDGIYDLRYGSVAINVWNAAAFIFPGCTWGAFPGHHRTDIQSGTGTVHNAFMFDRPQKTVVEGPFAPMPRAWRIGEFHTSPKPPWFVTNKTGHITSEKITRFAADPGMKHIPSLFASALRG